MAEHKYAQVLRWIADGEDVQARLLDSDESRDWCGIFDVDGESNYSESWEARLLRGDFAVDQWEFRIKTKTVKIGNREVEAPVLNPKDGQILFWWDSGSDEVRELCFSRNSAPPSSGDYFSSYAACISAREAITALLTGKE